jgi:hypothetical protein
MRIDSSGNVGIGVSAPVSKLDVVDTNCIIYSRGSAGYGSFFAVGSGTNQAYLFLGNAGGEKGRITSEDGGALTFSNTTSSTERMRIDSAGNIGIGTSSPDAGLTVIKSATISSQANVAARIGSGVTSDLLLGSLNGNAPFVASQGAYPLIFYTNAAERARIDSSGNVGIGTSSPGYKLDVKGSVRSSIGTGTGAGGAGYALYQFGTSATATENWHIGSEGDGSFRFYNQGIGAGLERMRLDAAGNVGIGTSSPGDKLEIGGAGAGIIMASPDGTRYRITVSNLGVLTVAAV